MQNIDEAYRMLDAFSSVGARHLDVIFLDIDGSTPESLISVFLLIFLSR